MSDNIEKVFVYGTLKVGGHFAKSFDKVRRSSVKATTGGKLISVQGRFPGLLPGDGVVHGEIHEYDDIKGVIHAMDSIEGYHESHPKESLYRRELIEVETESGDIEEAYAYFFNQSPDGMDEVESGVWEIGGNSK